MKNPIQTFEPNLVGRDFAIGDLHGSYSVFQNLLKNINFDPTVDRMFSVGDLVDRGPDSYSCLMLIHEPWFHPVLANHEQMMIEKFRGGWIGNYWYQNGGFWGAEAYNDFEAVYIRHDPGRTMFDRSLEIVDTLPLLEELPFLITVNTKSGKKFHLIHAELPSGVGSITDEVLEDPEKVLKLATIQRGDGDAFLWARYIFGSFYNKDLSNRRKAIRMAKYGNLERFFNDDLSHIISGHTIVHQPITVIGQTDIDTGAYNSYWVPAEPYSHNGIAPKKWAGLTCVELDTWKFYQATDNSFKEVKPFVITKQDIEGLDDNPDE